MTRGIVIVVSRTLKRQYVKLAALEDKWKDLQWRETAGPRYPFSEETKRTNALIHSDLLPELLVGQTQPKHENPFDVVC